MKTTRLRIVIATAAAALTVTVASGQVAPTDAVAAPPKTVKAGSTGNKNLDDICKQMADLINDEITNGHDAEASGDYGAANAWFSQATDHISRAQGVGCVMSLKARPRGFRYLGAYAPASAKSKSTGGSGSSPTPGGATVMLKKISGTAGTGKGKFSQSQCNDIASWVNDALKKSADAAAAGDPGLAAGWRQNANDLLAAGRAGGCTFSAALRAQQITTPNATVNRQ